eukprot:3656018-Alexandrium_andersonii.AAC.1
MQSASADGSWQATGAWGWSATADGVPAQSWGGVPQSGAGAQQPTAPSGGGSSWGQGWATSTPVQGRPQ